MKALKAIGAGQFGEVYLARMQFTDGVMDVAVKMLREGSNSDDLNIFLLENKVMCGLNHDNLVKLLGVSCTNLPMLCIIECMKYGDLRDMLQTSLEKDLQLTIMEQFILAGQVADGNKTKKSFY